MASSSAVKIPTIAEDAILQTIKMVTGICMTSADLKTPSYEKIYPVYSGFVCSILNNISLEQLTQVPMYVMETVAHPELNIDEAVGPIMFMKALQYVLTTACCIHDFSMSDLTSPDRKRTKKILAAMTNHVMYLYDHDDIKVQVLSNVTSLQKGVEIYASKQEQLVERISKLKSERFEKQQAVQEMNLSALKARQEEINSMKEQQRLKGESRMAEVEELQNLLTVTRASRLLQQAKESIAENTNRSLMLMKKQKLFAEFGEIPPYALKAITGVDQYSKKFINTSKELECLKDKCEELSKQLRDITSDEEKRKLMMKSKSEIFQRLETKIAKDKQENLLTKQFEMKKNSYLKEIEQHKKCLDDMRDELKMVTEQQLLQKQDHRRGMKALRQQLEAIERKFAFYENHVKTNRGELYNVLLSVEK